LSDLGLPWNHADGAANPNLNTVPSKKKIDPFVSKNSNVIFTSGVFFCSNTHQSKDSA
jgi:hypothetical protein